MEEGRKKGKKETQETQKITLKIFKLESILSSCFLLTGPSSL